MEFLNPAALYAFFLLPLLLLPYLIKRRARRRLFSSLLLLRELSSRSLGKPWGKLYLPPMFFLQLLLLFLLILALSEPVLSIRPLKIAMILDNSASMQALEGKKSRFELAQEEARDLLGGLSADARVDLYRAAPGLEQVGEKELAPGAASPLIAALKPYDVGERTADYGEELSRLAKEKGYERIFFLTDHPARSQGGAVRLYSVGGPRENLAITSFRVTRSSFASAQLEARVEVASFSSREEKARLMLKGDGRILFARPLALGPRQRIAASFENVPAYPAYEAEIEVNDALALDNHRFAVAPLSGQLEVLGISPRPQALGSLSSVPGLSLKLVAPEAYQRNGEASHSLEIFHFAAPASLPKKHALFVLPPKENPLVAVGPALSRPVISDWREPHPLTRYVNFALFRPAYARALKPLSFGDELIQSPEGAMAIGLEREGFRYLVLGFDPFPYLGRENLPMSIFTLNLLKWFYDGLSRSAIGTGAALDLGPKGAIVVSPKGEKFPVAAGQRAFSQTFSQGLYEVVRGGAKEVMALNLEDAKESDLGNPAPIQLKEVPAASAGRSLLFFLWPFFLLACIVLLFVEWFLNPPVTGS